MLLKRRQIISGLASIIAAPALVHAESLMTLRGDTYHLWQYRCTLLPDIGPRWERAYKEGVSVAEYAKPWFSERGNLYEGVWTYFGKDRNIYSDKVIDFTKRELTH